MNKIIIIHKTKLHCHVQFYEVSIILYLTLCLFSFPKTPDFSSYLEKKKNGTLKIEDILDSSDVVNYIKQGTTSELKDLITDEHIPKLIDYCTKMPKSDVEDKIAKKFPYTSCELLCSENVFNVKAFLEREDDEINQKDEDDVNDEDDKIDVDKDNEDQFKSDEQGEDTKEQDVFDDGEENKEGETSDKTAEVKEENKNTSEDKEVTKEEGEAAETTSSEQENKSEETSTKENETKTTDNNESKEIEGTTKENETTSDTPTQPEQKQPQQVAKPEPPKPKTQLDKLYDIFDHLFSFLNNDPANDNYVLMGYFAKIVNAFLNSKADVVLKYIFVVRKNTIEKLLKHIGRKAIGTTIENIVIALNEQEKSNEYNNHLTTIAEHLIKTIQKEELNSLELEIATDTFVNCFVNSRKSNFILFFRSPLIDNLKECLKANIDKKQNTKIESLVRLYIKINETIIKDFGDKVTPAFAFGESEAEITNIIRSFARGGNAQDQTKTGNGEGENIINSHFEHMITYLKDIITLVIDDIVKSEKNEDNKLECTFNNNTIVRLGMKALIEWEYVRTVLDIIVNSVAKEKSEDVIKDIIRVVANQDLSRKLLETYTTYTTNNMFQNLFNQIINVIICENTPNELVTSFLIMTNPNPSQEGAPLKSDLIETIVDSLRTKNNFKFESKKSMNSFNFANDVDALKLIFNSTHKTINDLLSNEEQLKFFKEKFIAEMDVQFTKKLYLNDSKDKEEDFHPIYNDDENIQFSLETLREMIDFKLSIYVKYLNGEDYQKALDEHEEMLQKKEQDENDDNRSEKLSNEADGSSGMEFPADSDPLEGQNDGYEGRGSGLQDHLEIKHEEEEEEEKKEEDFNDCNFWKPEYKIEDMDVDRELELDD